MLIHDLSPLNTPTNQILTALVREIKLPITAKMRLLDTKEECVAFAKMIESTGVAALAVHPR